MTVNQPTGEIFVIPSIHFLPAMKFAFTLSACLLLVSGPLWAQATPSAAEMVEQLKVQPAPEVRASGPRTRSLRNLTVEAVAPESAALATRPSLSLLIQFDFNSASVKTDSQQILANLAQAMQSKELGEAKFALEGHTDAKGGADYNLKLSQQRADAVRNILTSHGVLAPRLVAIGKGFNEPANLADPLAAENRRVRVVNLVAP